MPKSNVQPIRPAVTDELHDLAELTQTEILQAQSIARLVAQSLHDGEADSNKQADCASALGTVEYLLDRCWSRLQEISGGSANSQKGSGPSVTP